MKTAAASDTHLDAVRHGRRLEYLTVAWNSAESAIALLAGALAASPALIGFGVDSLIEVTSAGALLWRLRDHADACVRDRVERQMLRVVAWCFFALAAYLTVEAGLRLLHRNPPETSPVGIILAVLSLMAMPWLARQKRQVAAALGSAAMSADATQTQICAYLSAIMLAGLAAHLAFGWWWADPVGALLMVPLIVREGLNAMKGQACGCH